MVAAVVIAVPLWASMSYAVRHADVAPASEKKPQEAPKPDQSVPTSGTDAAEQMLRDVFGQQRAEESMRRYRESVDKARKGSADCGSAAVGSVHCFGDDDSVEHRRAFLQPAVLR